MNQLKEHLRLIALLLTGYHLSKEELEHADKLLKQLEAEIELQRINDKVKEQQYESRTE